MKHLIWFLPQEYVPTIATLLIVSCGFAVMLIPHVKEAKVAAIFLFVIAVLLLAGPVFDVMIGELVDSLIDVAEAFVREVPWWVTAGLVLFILLSAYWKITNLFRKKKED